MSERRRGHVLIVEDTETLAMVYRGQLERAGVAATVTGTGAAALSAAEGGQFDLALLDLQLPDADGLELIASFKALAPDMAIVIVTSDGSINRAVEAMRLGALDYLVKPFSKTRLLTTVSNVLERSTLKREVAAIKATQQRPGYFGFVGSSARMQAIYRAIDNVAQSTATVFITGESGTGKEVCARAIHDAGPRAGKPFIAVNCGAIPKDLIESELFGHLKGSFTGAISDRPGAARLADGGTLFLDEICEMDVSLQTKLLRFLQTSKVQPVGGAQPIAIDIRVVCATNRDPAAEVEAGRFREDLYYRLNVIPIHLPPLRERGGDVEEIARRFLDEFASMEGKRFDGFAPDAATLLAQASWPGNVRQLQNVVRRLAVMEPGGTIDAAALSLTLGPAGPAQTQQAPGGTAIPSASETGATAFAAQSVQSLIGRSLKDIERLIIEATITHCGGSLPKAADMLDVSPSTLYRKKESWDEQAA